MKKYIFTIVLIALAIVGVDNKAQAATVFTAITTPIHCGDSSDCGEKGIYLPTYKGTLNTTVIKEINFVRSNGSNTNLNFNLTNGQSVTLSKLPTQADWMVIGGQYDTPPADGILYHFDSADLNGRTLDYYLSMAAPNDDNSVRITSSNSNVVSCTTTKCTAVGPGTANVVVSFPNETKTTAYTLLGASLGYGKLQIKGKLRNARWEYFTQEYTDISIYNTDTYVKTYQLPSVTYTITVPPNTNTPQVTSCASFSAVSSNSASISWTYSDPYDSQSSYLIQISTDSNFVNNVSQLSPATGESVANTRSKTISGLNPGTKYYARIKTYNATDGWGNYSSCAASATTLASPPPPTNESAVCGPNNTSVNFNWTNAVGYNTIYFRAWDKTSYPYSDPQSLWNNNVIASSYNLPITKGHQYDWWINTKNTSNNDYSREFVGGSITCSDTNNIVASCYSNKSSVGVGSPVIFTSSSVGGNGVNRTFNFSGTGLSNWSWNTVNGPSVSTSTTLTYSTIGTKTFNVSVSDGNGLTGTNACSVEVVPGNVNPTDESGKCGSATLTPTAPAPTNNLCSKGNNTQVSLVNDFWTWICSKTGVSGTDASCSVSNGSGSLPCNPTTLDGIQMLPGGEGRTFYSSRISKDCSGKSISCPVSGGDLLYTGEDTKAEITKYKFQKCVTPGFDEF